MSLLSAPAGGVPVARKRPALDRKAILQGAWRLARAMASELGGLASSHLGAAQRQAWRAARAEAAPAGAGLVLADLAAAVDAALAMHAGGRPGEVREVRALDVLTDIPPRHVALPVTDERWMPHLRPGEFAVLNADDVEPQLGELYALTIGDPRAPRGRATKIVQPRHSNLTGTDAVMFGFGERRPGASGYVDGPLGLDGWRRTCRGRVVGVLAPIGGEAP